MGIFDTDRCWIHLPDGGDNSVELQTTSFPDPCLFHYTLIADGPLYDASGNHCIRLGVEMQRAERDHHHGLASFRWFAPP